MRPGPLRLLAAESASMEEAGQRVTGYLYQRLRESASNNRACVLVRSFKTHAYAGLSQDLRDFAVSMAAGTAIDKDTKCLTLLATSGDEPHPNSRRTSKGHRAIPLISEATVGQFPGDCPTDTPLGLATSDFIRTRDQIIKELDQRKFGVLFHVPVATNSSFIPAQNTGALWCCISAGIRRHVARRRPLRGDNFRARSDPRLDRRNVSYHCVESQAGPPASLDKPVFAD